MRFHISALLLLLLTLVSGCSQQDIVEKLTTADEGAQAIRFVEALRDGNRSILQSSMEADTMETIRAYSQSRTACISRRPNRMDVYGRERTYQR